VGSYIDAASVYHGYRRSPKGSFATFDGPPSSTFLQPLSINSAEMITGFYEDSNHLPHGFLYARDGIMTTFDAPGAVATFAQYINQAGAITGYYWDGVSFHGFVRTADSSITTFDPPGSVSTMALSINAAGAIAGLYTDSNAVTHGFVRSPGGN
jgi:hypothetical protein